MCDQKRQMDKILQENLDYCPCLHSKSHSVSVCLSVVVERGKQQQQQQLMVQSWKQPEQHQQQF